MMRLISRIGTLLTFILLLTTVGFAKTPAKSKRSHKKTVDSSSSSSSDTQAGDTQPGETATSEAAAPTSPALPAQKSRDSKKDKDNGGDYKPAPKFTPMLATTGTIGVFTVETADTLPKHGFAFSAFGNKFGRMPGSVTLFQVGIDASYGITDNLNVYAAFDPYGHVHVGCPGQLSLRSIPLSSTCAPVTFGSSV